MGSSSKSDDGTDGSEDWTWRIKMEVVNIRDQSPGERVVEEEATWENP